MDQDRPDITAQLTVAELLKHYPELEKVLIEQAPMFEKIQNPVLRKTVAKVATLEKAAGMAGIAVAQLVNAMREAAGLPRAEAAAAGGSGPGAKEQNKFSDEPAWVSSGKAVKEFDADGMLAEGVHPLNLVQKAASGIQPGEMIKITSSFPPIPLADALKQQGFATFTSIVSAGVYVTYIGKE